MSILQKINGHDDLTALDDRQRTQLCGEIREFLISNVSKTGGHLAGNLGVVELSVAIETVFNTEIDRLVFDVGHQSYVHKLLTGRQADFPHLRQYGGLSGFPKPSESNTDAFVAGHASSSVSIALGMARARTLLHQDYNVVALIGDGAMGGGLSFEGLNDAGASGEPLIVILNDNGMSIAPNVGGLSRHLSRLRSTPGYYEFKRRYRQMLTGSQTGKRVYAMSHEVKTALKNSLLPGSTVFENMGFTYMGPVDGHDVETLTQMLVLARDMRRPVLLHVHTVKGKGYPFAQKEPGQFHGVAPFDVKTGKALKPSGENFSHVFGQELLSLAREDERICAVTAAMVEGTGLTDFSRTLPRRFFDVGIAEGHAVAMCAGMAQQGMVPVFAVYSSFLQRGYDMLLHDVALNHLHVVLGVDRAGLVGADGETHHGCFDPMYLSQVPGMTVLCPASFAELRRMLRRAVEELDGPVAVRYPRGGQGRYQDDGGDGTFVCLREGDDAAILTYGILVNQALDAAELLAQKGIRVRVVKLNQICPLDSKQVKDALSGTERLLVLEDCMATGCVGQRIAAILAQERMEPRCLTLKNLGGRFAPQGTVDQLYKAFGLDARSVAHSVEEMLHEQ